MPQDKLIAADQALAFASGSMPQNLIDAWSYTTTFAQAHARTVNPDPSSKDYFSSMTDELAKLAWNVTEAGKVDYSHQADRISPARVVSSILNPYIPEEKQGELTGILDAIQQPDSGVHSFLTFWWNKSRTHADKTNMAMGPLTEVSNSSNIVIVYYSFNFDADSWRSLFVCTVRRTVPDAVTPGASV